MLINYKNKNDIPYLKFIEFSDLVEDQPIEILIHETNRIFNPVSVDNFSKACVAVAPAKINYKLDLSFKTAGHFVDSDTYYTNKNYREFFKSILKPRFLFKKINFDKITFAEAEYYISKFLEFKLSLSDSYEYLYNPPLRASNTELTAGRIEREAFSQHYGPYAEMVYLLCNGTIRDAQLFLDWDLNKFLFWGEYLIRKRDVENIK